MEFEDNDPIIAIDIFQGKIRLRVAMAGDVNFSMNMNPAAARSKASKLLELADQLESTHNA